MKKTVTILSIAAIAASATAAPFSAQHSLRTALPVRQNIQPAMLNKSLKYAAKGGIVNGRALLTDNVASLSSLNVKAPAKIKTKADEAVPEIITEQPEGAVSHFIREGEGYLSLWGYIFNSPQQGTALDMVTSPDGKTVYLKDFVSAAATGTWLKGNVTEDGFSIPCGQYALYIEEGGYGYVLQAMKYTEFEEEGEMYITYEVDPSVTEIKFIKNADGSYKIEDKFCSSADADAEYIAAYAYSDDMSWSGFGDYDTSYIPFNESAMLFPDGAQVEDWVLKTSDPEIFEAGEAQADMRIVQVSVSGDKCYVGGLNEEDPQSVVVGTISDGKVSFASDQYLGIASGVYLYLAGGTYESEILSDEGGEYVNVTYIPGESLDFLYDAEAKTLKPVSDDEAMIINFGKVGDYGLYYYSAAATPELYYFNDVAATPDKPVISSFGDAFNDYGYIEFVATIPTHDVDGNFIDPEKMSYIVWMDIDGEQEKYTFYSDDYPDIESLGVSELVEVPYSFSSVDYEGFGAIYEGGSTMILFCTAPDKIGLQSVYMGGNERRESEIEWYDCMSAVKDLAVDKAAVPVAFYGVDGVKHSEMQSGINIVRMSDGSVRKMIVRK